MADYTEENNMERGRLIHLLAGLTEENLRKELPNGWTVADALAHLAFWDSFAVVMLHEWTKSGFKPTNEPYNAINQVVDAMARMIPVSNLLQWVRDSAEAADHAAEGTSPELAAEIRAGERSNFLSWYLHRRHHLDQIEELLRA
jgi:hypothetical protein